MNSLSQSDNYTDVLMKTLQNILPTSVDMHKINEHFIMEISYQNIVDEIIKDLNKDGYDIIKTVSLGKE